MTKLQAPPHYMAFNRQKIEYDAAWWAHDMIFEDKMRRAEAYPPLSVRWWAETDAMPELTEAQYQAKLAARK